jgi:isocitrate dehydrogenase
MSFKKTPITVAAGDGIGPEIMTAVREVLDAAHAQLDYQEIEVGERVYNQGFSSGIEPASWESLRRTGVLLKAPITTPQGKGVKSLNVTIRKTLGLFANVRPTRTYTPYIRSKHENVDLVIVRENEEDLYAGIEYRQSDDGVQGLKLMTRSGCERIVRYAFEYAQLRSRAKLTCMTKDNIMKMTDGLFHQVFEEVALEYPNVETEHMIVDIGMARVADTPERFDVMVTSNLYGDIMSDVAAQICGSVGVGGSINIGPEAAMFEAIHGSAPDIAGQGIANPSGLLLAAVKMLKHIGQEETAKRIDNAWLKTIEDGVHTGDIYRDGTSRQRAGTDGFAKAVIARLGESPKKLATPNEPTVNMARTRPSPRQRKTKTLVGADVFVQVRWDEGTPENLASAFQQACPFALKLEMIDSRGLVIWPDGAPGTVQTDYCRCRFAQAGESAVTRQDIVRLLDSLAQRGCDFTGVELLYLYDGRRGFALAQGQ